MKNKAILHILIIGGLAITLIVFCIFIFVSVLNPQNNDLNGNQAINVIKKGGKNSFIKNRDTQLNKKSTTLVIIGFY